MVAKMPGWGYSKEDVSQGLSATGPSMLGASCLRDGPSPG